MDFEYLIEDLYYFTKGLMYSMEHLNYFIKDFMCSKNFMYFNYYFIMKIMIINFLLLKYNKILLFPWLIATDGFI